MMVLLVVGEMFNTNQVTTNAIRNNPINSQSISLDIASLCFLTTATTAFNLQITLRHIIIYTADIIHRIIFWRLSFLLNASSCINNVFFALKKQLTSCTIAFCFFNPQVKAKKQNKNNRYNK